jgi:uncharacterized FlaG/YvyC family protein
MSEFINKIEPLAASFAKQVQKTVVATPNTVTKVEPPNKVNDSVQKKVYQRHVDEKVNASNERQSFVDEQVPEENDALIRAAEMMESFIPDAIPNTKLRIDQDEETGRFIYQSIDKETGEVIRQFPAEELLRFVTLHRDAVGMIVDDFA